MKFTLEFVDASNRMSITDYEVEAGAVIPDTEDIVTLQYSNGTTSHWEVQPRRFWIRSDGAIYKVSLLCRETDERWSEP